MSEQEIKVPDLGGADEVEIIEISVSQGDTVEAEDPILTVESDKASVELPSPGAGKITRITVKVGDKVKEGDVVGMMEADSDAGGSDGDSDRAGSGSKEDKAEAKSEDQEDKAGEQKPAPKKSGGSRKQTVKVPSLDGFEDVPIIEINVSEGDEVKTEDPLVTVESDKATMEIPSPYAGKVGKILVSEGDKISEGHDLIEMTVTEEGGDESAPSEPAESREDKEDKAGEQKPAPKKSGGSRKETVKVPSLDGFEDVPIIEINISEGDEVNVEDPLVTVESDKATMEIPSPYAGKVGKILVSEGDKISEGHDLIEMTVTEEGGDESAPSEPEESSGKESSGDGKPERKAEPDADSEESKPGPASATYEPPRPGAKVHAGPSVRKLAREMGADLTRIKGSGPKSRILKEDVQAYVKNQLQQTQQGSVVAGGGGSGIPGVKLPDFSQFGEVKREAMSRMMFATANNMSRSWLNVPHVTQFEDADITDLEDFRKAQKAAGEKKGVKMTPLPFLLKACATALAELPQFNVSLDMDRKEVIRKKFIHIGVAVDTPNGLMVPVIRDVDKKGLWELAAESAELAKKARDKQLKPAEMQGACFTITSLGGIGGTAFTPIVNTPEVAILGVSKAAMKPVWDGKGFQPRLLLPLSLSYDHRAVNGADAARFTTVLSQLLGDIRSLLL